jgi:hypothetical protein
MDQQIAIRHADFLVTGMGVGYENDSHDANLGNCGGKYENRFIDNLYTENHGHN